MQDKRTRRFIARLQQHERYKNNALFLFRFPRFAVPRPAHRLPMSQVHSSRACAVIRALFVWLQAKQRCSATAIR
jgi:hypothetical protein